MATTEERLAALEAKLAALTATTPTEYYTHQYSGEEIDAAVGRAVTGGALDTSVTNVSKELGTFVRPNLLDNWYFGNPVDQRGGKIIQQGVNIYTDSALKTLIGPEAYACPVVELTSTYAKVQDAKNTSSYYYAAPGDVVRGYTGNGYTVDRWITDIDNGGAVLVGSNGITLTAQGMFWGERLTNIADLSGRTMTASVLMSDGSIFYGTVVISWSLNDAQLFFSNNLLNMYANKIGDDIAQIEFAINAANVTILAAKLELGPTQTLAHQDSAGNWVLNEVPDYGEQLRRCQRYFRRLQYGYGYDVIGAGFANTDNAGRAVLALDVAMRTVPSIAHSPSVAAITGGTLYNATLNSVRANTNTSDATLELSIPGITNRVIFVLTTAENNAYIDLSADL